MDQAVSDREIVRRFRSGDETAFDDLVRRYQKEIYRIAYRITGNHAEADDLAQETFCRAFGALGQFRGESSLRTWLCRIVSNLSLNVVQSARVTRSETASPEELPGRRAQPMTQEPEAPGILLKRERMQQLRKAIAALPSKQKSTLILHAFEGLPYKEIARVMRCSTGTAKANFFHAVSFLKRRLKGVT